MIGYWHDTIVCLFVRLSVTSCTLAKWYIVLKKYLKKWIGGAPSEHNFTTTKWIGRHVAEIWPFVIICNIWLSVLLNVRICEYEYQNNLTDVFQPPTPTLSPLTLRPYMLVPFGEYIKTYCKQANRQNFHVWNSHRHHAVQLSQTTLCDRLFLSNSWAICLSICFKVMLLCNQKIGLPHRSLYQGAYRTEKLVSEDFLGPFMSIAR